MCTVTKRTYESGTSLLICAGSGLPIIESNVLGNFCKEKCDIEDALTTYEEITSFFGDEDVERLLLEVSQEELLEVLGCE